VGRNAKRFRLAKGMTQEEVAAATDLSQQYVSDLERGLRNPTVITLFHLAQALSVEPAGFLRPERPIKPRR
jgi:transcriptional regulator with XRE-family HTH domain